MYASVYIVCVYLGRVCFSHAEEEAVEAWNRTEGIDEVTILESESGIQRDPERDRVRQSETANERCGERGTDRENKIVNNRTTQTQSCSEANQQCLS